VPTGANEPSHDSATLRQLRTVQSVRYNSRKLPLSMKLQSADSQARLEGVPGQRSIYETFLVGSIYRSPTRNVPTSKRMVEGCGTRRLTVHPLWSYDWIICERTIYTEETIDPLSHIHSRPSFHQHTQSKIYT
jgi:hypothetical protein